MNSIRKKLNTQINSNKALLYLWYPKNDDMTPLRVLEGLLLTELVRKVSLL